MHNIIDIYAQHCSEMFCLFLVIFTLAISDIFRESDENRSGKAAFELDEVCV